MKKIGICNNKGGVGKTTISLCLSGALAEMCFKVLLVDMDQQGSLSSSFLPDIHNLSLVVTDAIRDDRLPIEQVIQLTKYPNIHIIPSNLSLGKLESELQSERDSHYYLADKIDEIREEYDIILLDSPLNLGLATWSVLTAVEGVIIPLEAQDYRLAAPYANVHAGTFFPLAPENQDGKKKHRLLRCRSLGFFSKSSCQ